jgi:hypothetical protein
MQAVENGFKASDWRRKKALPQGEGFFVCVLGGAPKAGERRKIPYFGGAGANPSRLRPGSGLGLGFGAFLTSFLPLSLLPMVASVTQKGGRGKA